MNVLNKDVRELSNKLSITLDKVRLAAYAGVAYGYIEVCRDELKTLNPNDIKIKLYDLYYELNEVAVLDEKMFIDTCNRFINFMLQPMEAKGLIMSFDDAMGLTSIFGQGTIDAINENINLFKETRGLIKRSLNSKA